MFQRHLPTTDQVVQAFERAADRTRARTGRAEIVAAAGVAIGLGLAWLIAYGTNGASSSLMPLAYLPIIAAGSRERYALLQDSQQRISDLSPRNLRLFARLASEGDELTAGHCERVESNAVILGRPSGCSRCMVRPLQPRPSRLTSPPHP